MAPRILIVDDEKKIRNILSQILSEEGYSIQTCRSGEESLESVESFSPELILMDQNMTGMNGIEAMFKIKEKNPSITVIILTAYGSIPLAVEAMRKGAYDYLTKPFDNDELLIVVRRSLEHNRLTSEILQLKEELREKYRFENIIGVSTEMQRLFEQMRRVCDTNATVLVQGESGTGKELVAKAIHYHSKRKDKPLISVNCGAIPINLIESEFFGHEKGAFTDAKERKTGKFEQAHCGTLFLDEIGELPVDAQVKLLKVLEDKTITRIGGKETIPIDVRIIAASNKNLEEEVTGGNFRLDLFYRLNIFTITIPPLRERKKDIPLLVEHFIEKYNTHMGLSIKSLSLAAIGILESYDWPGNVRDIENAVQRAMILSEKDVISVEDLPLRVRGFPEVVQEKDIEEAGLEESIKGLSEKLEKGIIIKSLEKFSNNRTNTADALKISRKTLFNKMKHYGIS